MMFFKVYSGCYCLDGTNSVSGSPVSTDEDWFSEGRKRLMSTLERKINTNVAKNIILFIGDGMDITTVTASRIYDGQNKGLSGEENQLNFERFPNVALSKVRMLCILVVIIAINIREKMGSVKISSMCSQNMTNNVLVSNP